MKEISLNILDIAENSVKAKASITEILIDETSEILTLTIKDDGCGMDEETVKSVIDPFYTTRKTTSNKSEAVCQFLFVYRYRIYRCLFFIFTYKC